ncbi:MAG: type II toxin-antitoxin system VapC family toxin [Alphaproteobacteria bacterium]|nr:type II toxin-antitoxin system VapC family toxin [Alphaproteobacteria bacterium]
MILIDASVWIDHIRTAESVISELVNARKVLCHPFVIGEVGTGQFRNRRLFLSDLEKLRAAELANDDEVMALIERHGLFGRGIGYIDAHLLASAFLTPEAKLWTRDKRLREAAKEMELAAEGLE